MDRRDEEPATSNPWDEAALESAAGAASALVGGLIGGPGGALIGGALTPYALTALDGFVARWGERRRLGAGMVLVQAADELSCSVDEVVSRAESDPQRELLAGQAVLAGAATTLNAKIMALGRVLARSLEIADDAALDETATILAALTQMEAPHIQLLAQFAVPLPGDDPDAYLHEGRSWSLFGLRKNGFDRYGVALPAIVVTLETTGLILQQTADMTKLLTEMQGPLRNIRAQEASTRNWRITSLGKAVHDIVRTAAHVDSDPS